MLMDHMSKGLSFTTFAAVAGVSVRSLHEWTDENNPKFQEDFARTKKEAFAACQLFWERLGIGGASGKLKNFSAATWIYNMKCRFPNEWLDHRLDESDKNVTVKIAYDRDK